MSKNNLDIKKDIIDNLSLDDLPNEEWIDCLGFEGYYQISSYGRVKSLSRIVSTGNGGEKFVKEKILKQTISKQDQAHVKFSVDGISHTMNITTLVGEAFHRDKHKKPYEVYCHLNKLKFDNRKVNISVRLRSDSHKLDYKKSIREDWGIKKHGFKTRFKPKIYPKGKDVIEEYPDYKIVRRGNKKRYIYKNERYCPECGNDKNIEEFYVKDNDTGRRDNICRICALKREGVIDVGAKAEAEELFKKGLRKCSVCKEIKPLSEFYKNKKQYGGISNNCSNCAADLLKEYQQKQKEEIGDQYVREYGKRKGIKKFTNKIIEQLRTEIEISRKPKYFLDGEKFVTKNELADYIENKYKVPRTTVLKRLSNGLNEKDCTISKAEMRRNRTKKK